MPLFRYKAADAEGRVFTDVVEKADSRQVYLYLKTLGYSPIKISESKGTDPAVIFFTLKKLLMAPSVSADMLSIIAGTLGFALESGMSVNSSMELLMAQITHRQTLSILRGAAGSLQTGEGLWVSLEGTGAFPDFFVYMTRVGEESGRLPEALSRMSDYYRLQAQITAELKNAMLYPAGVSLMMLGVIIIAVVFVVPNYAQMFASGGAELPLITRLLIDISTFVGEKAHLLAAGLTAFTAAAGTALKTPAGESLVHRLLLSSGTYVKILNLRFAGAMSLMSEAGVDIIKAIDISGKVAGNRHLSGRLHKASDLVRQGSSISEALSSAGYFRPMLIGLVRLGEQTGRLPEVFAKCEAYLSRETAEDLNRLKKLAEPVIMIMLGGVLALIMLAILLPTFYLADIV